MPRGKRKKPDYSNIDPSRSDDEMPPKKRKISKQQNKNCSLPIPFQHHLPSTICLRTTDESIKGYLLLNNDASDIKKNIKPELSEIKLHDNNQILANIENIFSREECATIIQQSECLKAFQTMNNKYNQSIRKSDRLLVLDEKLANLLWNRLHNILKQDIVTKHNVSTVPFGFGVLSNNDNDDDNKWNISSINIAMRVNKYDANNNDFFSFHKDAQFCASSDERSLFTLIIYLNDEFEGGETNFYFNLNESDDLNDSNMSDFTISEEIEHFGGIEKGYERLTVTPSTGDGIIFCHNIIHEGCKVETPNKYKYILKTDIVVKRERNKKGFAIETEESNDYERCLNYFVEAQKNELKGNKIKANELYEKSLFIRYLYPQKLLLLKSQKKQENKLKLAMEVDQIWLIIFDFCHIREIECISYLFENKLYHLYIAWKLKLNQTTTINEELDDNIPPYIPRLVEQYGCYHVLEFSDYDFFILNTDDCLRVAAIYAFWLMSHQTDSDYFVVEYSAHSQKAVAVSLWRLLADVFYHRQCHGAYFKIKRQNDTKDTIQCFNQNIDRDYMSIVHGAQYLGAIGLLSNDNTFYHNISCKNDRLNQILSETKIAQYIGNKVGSNMLYEYGYNDDHDYDDEHISIENVDKFNISANGKDDGLKYLNDLIDMKQDNNYLCSKTRIFQTDCGTLKYCLCKHGRDELEYEDDDGVSNYNQLIFDFTKFKLKVIKNEYNTNKECKLCLSLDEMVRHCGISKYDKTKTNYTVNIESLLENGKYSLSFNHAGGPCCDLNGASMNVEFDCNVYLGYSHIKHIHIVSLKTDDNKARLCVSYNGLSAI